MQRCRAVLAADPANVGATRLLGQLLRESGDLDGSIRTLAGLHRSRQHDVRVAAELGASLVAGRQPARAVPLLKRAAEAFPREHEHRVWLGRAMMQMFRPASAIAAFRDAAALAPDDTEVSLLMASALLSAGRATEAGPMLERLAVNEPNSPAVHIALGQAREHLSDPGAALLAYRRAVAGDTNGGAVGGVIRCLLELGQTDEALETARDAHHKSPTLQTTLALARALLALRRPGDAMDVLGGVPDAENIGGPDGIALWFTLGEARERLGEYHGAFEAFAHANSMYPATFQPDRLHARHRAWSQTVHPALRAHAGVSSLDATGIVFVVGMPRSGTTLIEQILDSHPDVHGCGELTTLSELFSGLCERSEQQYPDGLASADPGDLAAAAGEYVETVRSHAPDAKCWIDKLPHNFEMLGLIDAILPGARVVHCTRHPLDTCLSCFTTQLSPQHDYATDLESLGVAYAAHARLTDHWREVCGVPCLDMVYEDVVHDVETQARRMTGFLGLGWHEACAEPWMNRRSVSTASVEQVRRPVYTTSVGRFERFREHLGPLEDTLQREGVALG